MKSSHDIFLEGNELYKSKNYQEAIHKFDEAIKLSPNQVGYWMNKGFSHQVLKQYAESMYAFESALAINPQYQIAKDSKIKLINLIVKKSAEKLKLKTQGKKYAEEVFRGNFCKTEYLDKLSELLAQHQENKKSAFSEQIEWILQLIEFIGTYYSSDIVPHNFIKDGLFSSDDTGKETRLHELGNDIIYNFGKFPSNVSDFLNQTILNTFLPTLQNDIFFEDAEKILRMVFETIYQFSREERGRLIDHLPWEKNSWYLFEFCGAIFSGSNADKENDYGGIPLVAYSFSNDIQKQTRLKQYHFSVMNHSSIIKISILDILRTDIICLKDFFTCLLQCRKEHKDYDGQPMRELPNLKAILWYSKQTYNILRLLSLLPHVPGNSDQINENVLQESNITGTTNFDQNIDFEEFLLHQKFKSNVSSDIRNFSLSLAKKIKTISYQDLVKYGLITDVSPVTYGMEKPVQNSGNSRIADFVTGPITPLKRLQLTSASNYLDIDTKKGRLAFLRKLQLTGEIFIPRNWGNDLKYINYISSDMLSAIRNGLVHIEDNENYAVIFLLEEDKEKIKKLFRELQSLKEQMYEATIERQSHFLDWPENYRSTCDGSDEWKNFANDYWRKIKEHYQLKLIFDGSTYIPNEQLLTNEDLLIALSGVKPDKRENIAKVLGGKIPYVIESSDLIDNITDKTLKKQLKNIFKASETKYKNLKNNARLLAEEKNKIQKEKREHDILKKMADVYPEMQSLGKNFWECGKKSHVSHTVLFDNLKNRLNLLNDLFEESGVKEKNKRGLQDKLSNILKIDIALQLSVSYILGQVFSILNKLSTLTQLDHVHSDLEKWTYGYIALRNVLEHSDPILETIDLPYYQMLSDIPRMMAVVLGELFFDYKNIILTFDVSNLPDLPKKDSGRLKQENAINPENFVFDNTDSLINLLIESSRKSLEIKKRYLSKPKKNTHHVNTQDLIIKDFGAEGDCLFRSIDGQMNGIGFDNLRQIAVIALEENRENFEYLIQANTTDYLTYIDDNGIPRQEIVNDFDRYLDLMSRHGTWGGQIEIAILARILQRPICLLADEYLPMVFPSGYNTDDGQDTYDGEPIMLFYNGVNHYQAVLPPPDVSRADVMNTLLQVSAQYQSSEFVSGSSAFFTTKKEHDLYNNRNADSQSQKAFDERFGLTVRYNIF